MRHAHGRRLEMRPPRELELGDRLLAGEVPQQMHIAPADAALLADAPHLVVDELCNFCQQHTRRPVLGGNAARIITHVYRLIHSIS